MIALSVTIVPRDQQDPIFPTIRPGWKEGQLKEAAVLEAGMQSGSLSIMMRVDLADGSSVVVQTSAAVFAGIQQIIRGAEQRFGIPTPDSKASH